MEKIIIFGGCGFLGSWIVSAFLKKSYSVTIFDLKIQKELLSYVIGDDINKIKFIKELINDRPIKIQVDGGINKVVAPRVIDAGANVIVAGSAVFNGDGVESYSKNIKALRYKI